MSGRRDTLTEEEIGLDELAAPAPDENPNEQGFYRHESLETNRQRQDDLSAEAASEPDTEPAWLVQLYIVSYLIFFSIFGVLARMGLQALTLYPGALIADTDLWANVGGSLLMGLFREDRMLFRRHWRQELDNARQATANNESSESLSDDQHKIESKKLMESAGKSFSSAKGGIPAYVGLTVGFCGSFTSFASICRDAFLAISNDLNTAVISTKVTTSSNRSRSAGNSVMAVLAVLILEVGLSIASLNFGAHLATAAGELAERVPVWNLSRITNPLAVLLGPGCWTGAVLLLIWPVHDDWRGQVLFALVFAPVGCLLRFQLSVRMNRIAQSFPLGTFAANVFGTCVLGMAYDLQRSSVGNGLLGCQALEGIMEGFCGALTTVSTFVLELDTLRLKHAYYYGICSLFAGVGLITCIMGPLRWTSGFSAVSCKA